MAVIIGSARIDEKGKISGGAAGDQKQKSSTNDTVGEVSMQNFYMHTKGWFIFRPKDPNIANKIAANMKTACNNANLGYDQGNRLGIIEYGINTKTKTECDCSSLVRECIKEASGKDPGNFTTYNEPSVLEASGLFETRKEYTSGMALYTGDVLVTKTKGHTAIVVSGTARSVVSGSSAESSSAYYDKYTGTSNAIDTVFKEIGVPSTLYGNVTKRKPIATANGINGYTGTASQNLNLISLAKKGILKKAASTTTSTPSPSYKIGSTYTLQADSLNVRTGAGTSYAKVTYANLTANAKANAYLTGALKKGTKVTCQATKNVSGNIWMQIPSGWIAAYYGGKYYVI